MPTALTGVAASAATAVASTSRNISDMTGQDFLKLLISQLSSQDPFEPMKNKEILEQLSAIRSLEANMNLSENIKGLLSHQELASATLLIGRSVRGLDTQGQLVAGKVERIILDAGGIRVQVGDHEMLLGNITSVAAEEALNVA